MGYEKPADYIEVKDRLPEFFAKFPDGTLTGSYELTTINGNQAVIYTAHAYRTPDDPRPGVGTAYEPIPGLTPYTRGSEIQNAETAAWGRAMIATGAVSASKGVASADEVRGRQIDQQAAAAGLPDEWDDRITDLEDDPDAYKKLRALYTEAQGRKASRAQLAKIKKAGELAAKQQGDQS